MYEAKPLAEHIKSRRHYSWYKPHLTALTVLPLGFH